MWPQEKEGCPVPRGGEGRNLYRYAYIINCIEAGPQEKEGCPVPQGGGEVPNVTHSGHS